MTAEIVAPKRDLDAKTKKESFKALLTNHYRSLDAATPIRFTMSRYTRIESRTREQPLVAEHKGGTESTLKPTQLHPPHT